jgi:sec-independent protein translocase protein TatC
MPEEESTEALEKIEPEHVDTPQADEEDMGFFDHLDELRTRLFKSLIGLVIVAAGCAFFSDFLVNDILIGPLKRSSPNTVIQNLVPYGQVTLYIQTIFFSALIITFPLLVYQIWQFVVPGLLPKERRATKSAVFFISFCFFCGIAFGYFIFLPVSLKFFASFGSEQIENNIAIADYISFFLGSLLTTGLVFELPFLSFILSKIGLLTPAFMRFYRKHAIVVLIIVAAIVTPSTDAVTQMVIAVPMILLYELSIWISGYVNRKNEALK